MIMASEDSLTFFFDTVGTDGWPPSNQMNGGAPHLNSGGHRGPKGVRKYGAPVRGPAGARKGRQRPSGQPDLVRCGLTSGPVPGGSPSTNVHEEKRNERTERIVQAPSDFASPEHNNSFEVLPEEEDDCSLAARLRKKAENLLQFFSEELGLEPERDLPPRIRCGELRSAVRGCFPKSLPVLAELSIKTSQKLERTTCRSCEPRFLSKVEEWREARFVPQEVDEAHLKRFSALFKENVPRGWNDLKSPYIPNGSASELFKRREGGNWNREDFSPTCRYELVISSGKPRIVTMYSSYNNRVLAPLHQSLFRKLGRQGWLLVGPPTTERIRQLNGCGEYLSFDYTSATDNIKRAYVLAMIEALIERANPRLTHDEERCLRVLGELRLSEVEKVGIPDPENPRVTVNFDRDDRVAERGMPMGSLMSFPLLCLFNKTVVDLALTDMLQGGQVGFREWTSHRCLINGDDLLLREVNKKGNHLRDGIKAHAEKIGPTVNLEKCLQDATQAEINSTLFENCELQKKSNAAAVYMKPDTSNVLEMARESTRTAKGFVKVVRGNVGLLARQKFKGFRDLPVALQRECKRDRKIRKALLSMPGEADGHEPPNFFPVCPRPEGYDLTVEEEIELIHGHVERVRDAVIRSISERDDEKRVRPPPRRKARSWRSVKYEKRPPREEETILRVLARGWESKQKELLAEEARGYESTRVPTALPPTDSRSRIDHLQDCLRGFRAARDLHRSKITLCDSPTPVPGSEGSPDPFVNGSEWIALV